MDIIQLYQDFNLDFKTEGHKHCRPGFVNIECPFCEGNPGYHLSYHLQQNYFVCWRCGWKPITQTIAALIQVSENEAKKIIPQYGGIPIILTNVDKKVQIKPFKLPSNCEPLQKQHKDYLIKRNFDPEKLEKEWGLFGTTIYSKLDKLSYKFRIVIPFQWNNEIVSFDSRDITGKAMNKYQACPLEREIIPHKNILYGRPEKWKSTGIVVEGPTDVWRFGQYSCATSGIKFTTKQVRLLSKTFKRIPVCYDGGELQAIEQADKLVSELKFRGVDSFRVDIEGDPGDMEQSEADYLVKQLIK